jgi:tetratricopeptide (TPR) repeat protein
MRVGMATLRRRYADGMALGKGCKEAFIPSSGGTQIPIEYFIAQIKWLAEGRKPPSEAARARDILQKAVTARPDAAEARMHLAFALTMLGDRRRAMEEAERALADLPMSRDAVSGPALRRSAIEVFANAGAEDRAIQELGELLRVPNGGHAQEIRLDPVLDPLHRDPRFDKLLAEVIPGTV